MNHLKKISLLICIVFGLKSCKTQNLQHQTIKKQPNFIYILVDDLGIGDIAALNPKAKVKTPNIDALVKNGISFTDAHASASICTPSRYSILTGVYAWRTKLKARVLDGYSKAMIKDETHTVPKLLKNNGYNTAMIGKWHLGWNWKMTKENLQMDAKVPFKYKNDVSKYVDYSQPFTGGPTDNGFDYFFGINASLDDPPYAFAENNRLVKIPSETMKSAGGNPNFPGGKQKDLAGKQKLKRKGDKAKGFKSQNVLLELTNKSVNYIANYTDKKPFFLYVSLTTPHTPIVPRNTFLGTSKAGIYGDFIQELDWTVGKIISAIKDKGLEDNTIIVFTADNGASKISFPIEFENKYNHKPSTHLRGRKATLHQGGHTVPFIIQWKNTIKPNTKNNTTISLADLYATCADIINAKTDTNQAVDSYSILSLLKGGNNYKRKASIYTNFGGRFSIRKNDWKMDLNPKKGSSYLFNIGKDPSETTNLFYDDSYEGKKKELTSALNEIILNPRLRI